MIIMMKSDFYRILLFGRKSGFSFPSLQDDELLIGTDHFDFKVMSRHCIDGDVCVSHSGITGQMGS